MGKSESHSENDFGKYLDPLVISKVSSFELRARFIVEGFLLGLHKSPYHGFSIEFSQHRPYMQGDPLKDVDWKVYGKTDRYYVKQYEEETNLKSYLLIDNSNSMSFRYSGRVTKSEYAIMLAAGLGYLMINQKDAVGLGIYSDKIEKYLSPKSSNMYFREVLTALYQMKPSGKTSTSSSLGYFSEQIKRRGLVIVFSDLLDDVEQSLVSLKKIRNAKNEVIVFHILDPAEKNFGFGRDSIFVDLETGEEMASQPYQVRRVYSEAVENYIHKIKKGCLDAGIDYNLIDTSTPFDKALIAYLQKRSRLH
ncbi:MAG: DUF58 domain-containing protein [Ignavibacteriaceae bacterium]|nr:DUF58 domain-containing protein [Ignavibacteriaceae bacterium]